MCMRTYQSYQVEKEFYKWDFCIDFELVVTLVYLFFVMDLLCYFRYYKESVKYFGKSVQTLLILVSLSIMNQWFSLLTSFVLTNYLVFFRRPDLVEGKAFQTSFRTHILDKSSPYSLASRFLSIPWHFRRQDYYSWPTWRT